MPQADAQAHQGPAETQLQAEDGEWMSSPPETGPARHRRLKNRDPS
jgi:hypothetical protein